MADIELVIKVPEVFYEYCKAQKDATEIQLAVSKGTPLPEPQPCEDCISRREAIKETKALIRGNYDPEYIIETLQMLTPVTPNGDVWHKYDDEDPKTWPKDGSWGLWQHKSGEMKVLRWKQDARNHFYPDPYMWDIEDVDAWRPLPKAYTESEGGDV